MKHSMTHYYVQGTEDKIHNFIVCHSVDKETNEEYYKFIERKKALNLAKAEKAVTPNILFRVVKCIETYDAGEWF